MKQIINSYINKLSFLKWQNFAYLMLFFIFAVELINTAWITDDAAITIRTVLNFVNGYGPVFNIGERVQAYTHTLWFFVVSSAMFVSNKSLYSVYIVSIIISLSAFLLLIIKCSKSVFGIIIASLIMIFQHLV